MNTASRGSVELQLDICHALEVMADMGSNNPRADFARLDYFGYRMDDNFHKRITVAGAPEYAGGVQGIGYIGVRVDTKLGIIGPKKELRVGKVEASFIHELQHYVDENMGLRFGSDYHEDVRTMIPSKCSPNSLSEAIRAYKRYSSDPLEFRARAAGKKREYRGILIGWQG